MTVVTDNFHIRGIQMLPSSQVLQLRRREQKDWGSEGAAVGVGGAGGASHDSPGMPAVLGKRTTAPDNKSCLCIAISRRPLAALMRLYLSLLQVCRTDSQPGSSSRARMKNFSAPQPHKEKQRQQRQQQQIAQPLRRHFLPHMTTTHSSVFGVFHYLSLPRRDHPHLLPPHTCCTSLPSPCYSSPDCHTHTWQNSSPARLRPLPVKTPPTLQTPPPQGSCRVLLMEKYQRGHACWRVVEAEEETEVEEGLEEEGKEVEGAG